MSASILVAGIGNIFQGDDAFGVTVAQRLLVAGMPEHVRVMDVGIRAIDLAFALLDDYDLTILVDVTSRGSEPGTLYTIKIARDDIPDACEQTSLVNSHSLDAVRVLSLAKSMGARLNKIFLVGCEPLILDCDGTGYIGLSPVVELAVEPALQTVSRLVKEFEQASTEYFFEGELIHDTR